MMLGRKLTIEMGTEGFSQRAVAFSSVSMSAAYPHGRAESLAGHTTFNNN
jgi:hypothetical protein